MKKRSLLQFFLPLLLVFSCSAPERPGGSVSSFGAETDVRPGLPVTLSVADGAAEIRGEDASFEIQPGVCGMKNGAGTRLFSRSGQTETDEASERFSFRTEWETGQKLSTELTPVADGICVEQNCAAPEGGVSATFFTLRIPDRFNIILPFQNGVRLDRSMPDILGGKVGTRFEYGGKNAIQMQTFIVEGEGGGFVVYAEDLFTQYKAISVSHAEGYFTLYCETIPQAPFSQYTAFSAVTWKIVPYKGEWTAGAEIYGSYMRPAVAEAYGFFDRPEWVGRIAMVIQTNLRDKNKLDKIASVLDPRTVLLQVSDYRVSPYDTALPDYTVAEDFPQYVDYAHSLGFRVQLHVNMIGCDMKTEGFENFEKYAMVNPFTGKKYGEDFTDAYGNHFSFLHINPASKEWREYMIGAITRLVSETGVDSVHLDQSLLAYNDGNGLIDGMTSMQGNIVFQSELLRALPDSVVIGGEGINDFNTVFGTFMQSVVYGADESVGMTGKKFTDQIVPVTPAVYPWSVIYHHPSLPTVSTGERFLSWYLGGLKTGHLPTLYRESGASISGGNSIMKKVIAEAAGRAGGWTGSVP